MTLRHARRWTALGALTALACMGHGVFAQSQPRPPMPPVKSPDPDAPDAPTVQISNGRATALIYMPDPERGYYRATRFDWSGAVADLKVDGHSYFGRWFAKYDPKIHDSVPGPVEDFASGQGVDVAFPGETYVKIGVGLVFKPRIAPTSTMPTFEIADPGKWTTHVHGDSVEFIHEVNDPSSGYGYRYTKTVSLPPGRAQMVISHRLESTGDRVIDTELYDHNFFVIDHQTSGPDFEVSFPFTPHMTTPRGFIELRGKSIVYTKPFADPTDRGGGRMRGWGKTAADFKVTVANHKTGAAVTMTADQPLTNFNLFTTPSVVAPEMYMHVHAAKKHPMMWTFVYDFKASPPKP